MPFIQGHALIMGIVGYPNSFDVDVPIAFEDERAVEKGFKNDPLYSCPSGQVEYTADGGATRHGNLGTDGKSSLASLDAE